MIEWTRLHSHPLIIARFISWLNFERFTARRKDYIKSHFWLEMLFSLLHATEEEEKEEKNNAKRNHSVSSMNDSRNRRRRCTRFNADFQNAGHPKCREENYLWYMNFAVFFVGFRYFSGVFSCFFFLLFSHFVPIFSVFFFLNSI